MKRPSVIKDKSALEYIEYLEKLLEEFKTHTKKKFYLGIQRQLDLLGDEMLNEDFKVSMKKTFSIVEGKSILEDSGFDGFFDMITKGEAIIKAMEKFESQAMPKQDEEKKIPTGAAAERHIFKDANS